MNMIVPKIICILIVSAMFCLPFFPRKFRFSLMAVGYDGKDRWRNILFVIEAGCLTLLLLSLIPVINALFDWIFNLFFIKWILDRIPDRAIYVMNVVTILVSNLLGCGVFFVAKKILRGILDRTVFADVTKNDPDEKKKKDRSKKKKTKTAQPASDVIDRSEKRLRLLRRASMLVFGKDAKEQTTDGELVDDYVVENPYGKSEKTTEQPRLGEDEDITLAEFLKRLWFGFIGLFYSEKDQYEYVNVGAYRFAKELKIFVLLLAAVYLVACLLIQIPLFFSFDDVSMFYKIATWLVEHFNTYPMLALVFLFELVWFVDGPLKEPEEAEVPLLTFIDALRHKKTPDVPKVQEALMKKYSGSYRIKRFDAKAMDGSSTYDLGEKSIAVQNMARAIRANRGVINGDYMQSVEYMLAGKHVLFDSSVYSALGEYVVHYLFVTLSFGKRVLFICKDDREIRNAAKFLEASIRHLTKTTQILWRIGTFEDLHEGKSVDILLLTPEQFLSKSLFVDGKEFFEELEDVFVLDADEIVVANNYYCLIMAKRLEKATAGAIGDEVADTDLSAEVHKRIRYRFFSNGHAQSLSNSLRQFFNLEDAPLEAFHSFALASQTDVSVWHTGLSSTLYVDNGANQVTLEMQIAKDASSLGMTGLNLISESTIYGSQANEIQGLTLNSCDLTQSPVGFVIVADDTFNLPGAIYNYSRFSGRKATVLHVISKPYLLREYFTARAEQYVTHFELIGRTISEHAHARRANIIILLCDAVNGIEKELFVKRATELLGESCCEEHTFADPADVENCVKLCFETAFGENVDCEPFYAQEKRQDSELCTKTFITIKNSEKLFEKLLECTKTVRLEYVNTQSVEYIPVFKNEIKQHFIPGQVLVRNNHAYTIKSMDAGKGVLTLDDTVQSVNVPMDYIQTRHYRIENAISNDHHSHDYRARDSVVHHMSYDVYEADVTADTVGYYSIEKALQTVDLAKPNFAKYVNLVEDAALMDTMRRQMRTKVLVVEMSVVHEVDPRETYLLSVVLQEFMKTVFPHQYRCVSVCPLFDDVDEQAFFENETAVRDLYPRVVAFDDPTAATADDKAPTDGEEAPQEKPHRIRFAVIEDIHGGNGIVESLIDGNGIMVTNLLHVVADFLEWMCSAEGEDYTYLHFGYEQMPAVFDAEKLRATVAQFRHDVERSEVIRRYGDNTCFFCHCEVDDEHSTKLEDGRLICDACRDSSVTSFEELDECLTAVVGAIKESTEVADTIPTDVRVDFVSTMELRQRYGDRGDTLPIAYCDHVAGIIYVEYGLPRGAVCGVIGRMITLLWQDRMIVNDGSAKFEAQLDHVEEQVLFALNYTAQANALHAFNEGNEKLKDLQDAMAQEGTQDSFAYLLGVAGKTSGNDVDPGKDTDKDVSFIAERDPASLPRYYYNQMNDDEKAVYDQLSEALYQFMESSGPLVRDIHHDRCYEILLRVLDDNPDIFWCANPPASISIDSSGNAKNVLFKYCMTAAERKRRAKQIEKEVLPFVKGIKESMSDYEVALRAHENIVSLIDYDSLGLDIQEQDPDSLKKPDDLRSVYGVFVKKKAVCAGYARAYQYLLNRLGIECTYVRGNCHGAGLHAWNLIKLEGDYYYVDVTWDDSSNTDERKHRNAEISYDFFAITTAELLKSRDINDAELYPECTATRCNYFVRSGLYLTGYDAQKISKMIATTLKSGKKEVAFKAKDAALLSVIKTRLITEQGIWDILKSVDASSGSSYSHYTNEDLNILHIIVG